MTKEGQQVILSTSCATCGKDFDIKVETNDLAAWRSGALIQRAFPYLGKEEREMLISRTCNTCWDRLFEFESEDDEEDENVF